ncbi:Zinc finger NHR/GATA-type [Penicillium canescens]|uniref:Zinc finger NHR/GATA-type n=1 Tax=Penicillium canescens TaxID=5083 RepID=A0AAD6IBU5_PENCN|nr:Zinc finger NHR/GATA-type [Penicillium canescens]KAJ6041615.1 Zinc finger NHR/GATA-type [Penicillium canescens]KAJ6050396.1 Zinc finger NHR/GATA-type [Penicillium canescens]KAJ6064696.1 Zinc finger NHR/GATA-type [Penicillium canescens]
MGSPDAAPSHQSRNPLPSLSFPGKDTLRFASKIPVTLPMPFLSPCDMYSGQHLPYTYAPSVNRALSQPGYISPPEPRLMNENEKVKAVPRQSLPSIHEAIKIPYPAPISAPLSQAGHCELPTPTPFFNGPASGSLMREPNCTRQKQLQTVASRNSLAMVNKFDSRNESMHTSKSGKSPTQSVRTGISSISGPQDFSVYDYSAPPSTDSVATPNDHSRFPCTFSFRQQPTGPSYPLSYNMRAHTGALRVEEAKGGYVGRSIPGQPLRGSGKRHLDVYDVEQSLNEIRETSTRTLHFSRHYAALAHQTQRPNPTSGYLPLLGEVEDMLCMQRRNRDALNRIRTVVFNQGQDMVEQMTKRKAFKYKEDELMALYQDEFKGAGGFSGANSKTLRGVRFALIFYTLFTNLPPCDVYLCPFIWAPLLALATAATKPKRQNGAIVKMVPEGCVMAAVCTTMCPNNPGTMRSKLKSKPVLDSASPTDR